MAAGAVVCLLAGREIKVLGADGSPLRKLTLDTNQDVQPADVRAGRLEPCRARTSLLMLCDMDTGGGHVSKPATF